MLQLILHSMDVRLAFGIDRVKYILDLKKHVNVCAIHDTLESDMVY